jgi:hypothetical protein
MSWFGKKQVVAQTLDAEQLRRVVALIPEYVECLVEEGRLRGDAAAGLDGREFHGPAERKLKKIEARLAEIIRVQRKGECGMSCAAQRKTFLGALPGAILTKEQLRSGIIGSTTGSDD